MAAPTQKQIVDIFNTHFGEFLDDIIRVFPLEESIHKAKTYINTITAKDPRMVITIWKCTVVAGYESQVMAGNIDFFINKDYTADLAKFGAASDKLLQTINDLRSKIRDLDEDNKAKTVKYMQNLTNISRMFIP
jgi:hypothetical protein